MSEPEDNVPFDHGEPAVAESKDRSFGDLVRQINARMVLGALAAVALIVFIAQNTGETRVNFLGWDWDLPLFLLLLITVALSVMCTEIVAWYTGRYRRSRSR
ncbi:lipopolysaccharide assembly protein LapA domain-containing protein [Candidatus Poriferisocius sp.]|uniref:lipopolysaccharide assembly protein LapA domain-containing protein n=1 Tax=Candidatus Poriferisocius sp. TaxID=3101276 RepID=UPI003B5B1D9F